MSVSAAPERLQPLVEADGLEVEVGESAVVVVDPGEAEGPPEMLELGQLHPGELGHLEPGVPPARRDEHPLGHEEVDHPVVDGLVDLLVGGAAHDEGLADPGQGRLPGRRRVGAGVVVVGGGVAVWTSASVTWAAPAAGSRPTRDARVGSSGS